MKIVLKKPANCQVVSQTTEAQQTFMETAGKRDAGQNLKIDWLNLVKQGDDNTNPAPVSFCWSADFNEANGFEKMCIIDRFKCGQIRVQPAAIRGFV